MLIDLVVNHTSSQHAWFQESKSSSTNAKRDWYIWKKPKSIAKDGTPNPPNNWSQLLGEASSAWNYNEKTGEFTLPSSLQSSQISIGRILMYDKPCMM